ncbi:putative metal-binding motif-containing protein [Candidatus Woesearchaeota archaeon]|nr:putative metal-binding motif-containing protein [Candidatus Woesearchaeota archaeon]
MKKILLLSLLAITLLFLVVSCAPQTQTQQTKEEQLTEQMHKSSALAGQAIRIRCATAAVTDCRVSGGNIYFTYGGYNYQYDAAWCSGTAALNAYAYNSRCISPTVYENCIDQCTGSERCSNGVCAVPGGVVCDRLHPVLCLTQSSCLAVGNKWLPFELDPDDAPRGCYASCPPGVVDANGDGVCGLADGEFGCSANNMCDSNNCDLARNTCVAVPPSPEICDNLDNDRDGVVDEGCDDDNDNFCDSGMSKAIGVRVTTCTKTPTESNRGNDCNDNNVAINPYANDLTCDGIDQNCDGGDGYRGGVDYCDGRDNECDGNIDQIGGRSSCPSCTDSDGGNKPLLSGSTLETWPAFPARDRVVYDFCQAAFPNVLNETVCISNAPAPGLKGGTVSVDCTASGQRCVTEGHVSRCG